MPATKPLIAALALAAASSTHAAGCDTPEHRAFDFWLGEWAVHGPAGRLAGTNSIRKEHGGCVVHERYATDRGYSGESLNAWDGKRQVWHQTWVDSNGLVLLLEGGVVGGAMVLEGDSRATDGTVSRQRITWAPQADGSVRQHWQARRGTGDWSTVFDGRYARKPAGAGS